MSETFYPFVENGHTAEQDEEPDIAAPSQPARIAVYDSMTVPPRVVTVPPSDVRTYLDEITKNVWELATQQGGEWPWHIIRELVENYIHASFIEPTISIMDKGQTISFSDQGPGIPNKAAALRPTFSSATKAMKRYIRGTGSGLPMVEATVKLQHGSISIEDNLGQGAVITVSLAHKDEAAQAVQTGGSAPQVAPSPNPAGPSVPQAPAAQGGYSASGAAMPYQSPYPQQAQQMYGQPAPAAQGWGAYGQPPVQGYPQQGWQTGQGQYPQPGAAGQPYYPYGTQPGWPGATGAQGYAAPQQPWGAAGAGQMPGTAFPQGAAGQPWPGAQGSAYPQQLPGIPPQAPLGMPSPAAQAGGAGEEERQALTLFLEMDKVGATEVSQATGMSKPTASRRLKEMSEAGLIVKMGQKYVLTPAGKALLDQIAQGR